MASTYQTYLFDCGCPRFNSGLSGMTPRILFKNLIPYCAWCRTPLVEAALMDYEEDNFPKEKKEMDKEMARDFEVELPSHLKDDGWQLKITRTDNGYIIEVPNELPHVIQENQNDELKEHEELLWCVMEYFNFQGSKHDSERLRIVREKQE